MSAICLDEPFGLQKLRQCSKVTVDKEWDWWNNIYVVACHEGVLCRSKGTHHHLMYDDGKQLVMGLNFKRPWFQSPYMMVQVVNCPAVTVCYKSTFGTSLLVVDHDQQPVLKINHSTMSNTIKILAINDVKIGKIEKDWGRWNLQFPADLQPQCKAALIGACIYFELINAYDRRCET